MLLSIVLNMPWHTRKVYNSRAIEKPFCVRGRSEWQYIITESYGSVEAATSVTATSSLSQFSSGQQEFLGLWSITECIWEKNPLFETTVRIHGLYEMWFAWEFDTCGQTHMVTLTSKVMQFNNCKGGHQTCVSPHLCVSPEIFVFLQ